MNKNHSDIKNIYKITSLLKLTMHDLLKDNKLMKSNSTFSLILIIKNSAQYISEKRNLQSQTNAKGKLSMLATLLLNGIGQKRELSIQLKIKDNADHAGLFQLQDHLKVLLLLKKEDFFNYQSNNWLTVQQRKNTEIKVVMEDK